MKDEIIIYQADQISKRIEVRINNETVWLSIEQIGTLFGRDRTVVNRHINKILKKVNYKKKRYVHFLHTPLNTVQLKKKLKHKILNTLILM